MRRKTDFVGHEIDRRRKPMDVCRPFSLFARRLLAVCFSLLTAHCLLPAVLGQGSSATLSGTVTDQNGAIVPGVSITVLNLSTASKRETITNEQGSFTVPLIPPGTYTIKARGAGFTPIKI